MEDKPGFKILYLLLGISFFASLLFKLVAEAQIDEKYNISSKITDVRAIVICTILLIISFLAIKLIQNLFKALSDE